MLLLVILLQLMLSANAFQFQGCYSDSDGSILQNPSTVSQSFSENLNSDCAEFCRDEGFAVSTTNGPTCYCTNTLPTPIIFSPRNADSGGVGGRCVTPCPGTALAKLEHPRDCIGDECCGGPTAYSVYLVGSIDALLQLERRVIQGLLSQDKYLLKDLFPSADEPGLINNPIAIFQTYVSRHHFYTPGYQFQTDGWFGAGIHGSPTVTAEIVYESSYSKSYEIEIDLGRTCTITEFKQIIQTGTVHSTMHFYYYNGDGQQIRYKSLSPVVDTSSGYNELISDDKIDGGGLVGVRKIELKFWSPSTFFSSREYGYGGCTAESIIISVLASGTTVDKDGVQGLQTYNLTYNTYTSTEQLSKTGIEPEVSQVNMKIKSMDKVLDYNEPVNESPLGSNYECTLTHAGAESECWRDYTITSSFSETFSTQAGINIETTLGLETEVGLLFTQVKNTFSISIGYSLTFQYTSEKTTTESNTFKIVSPGQPGETVLIYFTETYTPTILSWKARIVASDDVTVIANGYKRELDMGAILLASQRNLFALGTIDFGEQHFIRSHIEVRDVNGDLIYNGGEEVPVSTAFEDSLQGIY